MAQVFSFDTFESSTHSRRKSTKHMFTLQPPASCAPLRAFSVGNPKNAAKTSAKNASSSRSTTAIITRASVSDSPRIIVENDEETKKFRLRDHQREVIRDMSDFASGEVRTRDAGSRDAR